MDIAIDNSSLSHLDDAQADAVARAIEGRRARLVVPYPVTLEALYPGNEHARRRVRVLARLRNQLGDRFVVSPDLRAMIERERKVRMWRTPRLDDSDGEALNELLDGKDTERRLVELAPLIEKRLAKQRLLDVDRGAVKDIRQRFRHLEAEDVDIRLRLFKEEALSSALNPMVDMIHAPTQIPVYEHLMRAGPKRYRTAVIWCGQIWVYMLGLILAGVRASAHTKLIKGAKWGDWTDARIAACASYARVLLSEDEVLRERLNYVALELGLVIRATTLAGWIDQEQGRAAA